MWQSEAAQAKLFAKCTAQKERDEKTGLQAEEGGSEGGWGDFAYSGENDQVVWLKTITQSDENDQSEMQKLEVS
jgi:hypothetical protein